MQKISVFLLSTATEPACAIPADAHEVLMPVMRFLVRAASLFWGMRFGYLLMGFCRVIVAALCELIHENERLRR